MAPLKPKSQIQSLPPMLRRAPHNSLIGYSKGARGLSVFPREHSIFTVTTISLRPSLRQEPNRYAIHAGRNLPDKEFRYLRTVRVTAAVNWGFNSMRKHLLLAYQHRAGVRPYTSSYDLAESCVFNKQSPPPILCHLFFEMLLFKI